MSQTKKTYRIPEGSVWANAWKMTAMLAVIGLGVSVAGYMVSPERFAYSYLYGFMTVLTLWLGSVFFILIQHLTGAGWSVSVRRAAEFFAGSAWVLPVLFLPMLLSLGTLYPWWNGKQGAEHGAEHSSLMHESGVAHAQEGEHAAAAEHAAPAGEGEEAAEGGEHHSEAAELLEEANMAKKAAYLNHGFFFLRLLVYFGVWFWLGSRLFGYSVAQDAGGDKSYTVKLQSMAPPATFAFALSLTFAAFDWVMSLQPGWYSTMFGVRVFAASAVTSFAVIILVTLGWKRAGLVGNEINTEHYHDLGKLMFGFLIFWAYVSFSEFFLIWYAAIPEETAYYHLRWDMSSWQKISISIVVLKFIVPFYLVMSRNAKRNNGLIALGAGWILTMHLVEMYYWVMPYFHPGEQVQFAGVWMEVGCVMATLGVFLTVVFKRMTQHSLIAVGDPRLPRALDFVNQ